MICLILAVFRNLTPIITLRQLKNIKFRLAKICCKPELDYAIIK